MSQVRVGIGIFVFKDGRFLMGCRQGAHGEATWSVPGGHQEYMEPLEETARREVKEETGVDIENIRFGALTDDIFEEENRHYITIWMLSDWKSGEPTITEPDKFLDVGWFDFDSLPTPLFLPWQQLLRSEFIKSIKSEVQKS